ncbi:MAG: methylenetetrahydrofolate reductase C-terminal domain-containing protein [Actinobacteria bacterium]|nr:methylenetetrahydrofolate reductase C-terminal domain-containing protein [Actinomycetota bacterium]
MIIASQKSVREIADNLTKHKRISVAGCGTCVAVCFAGGERESEILASALRMFFKLKSRKVEIRQQTVKRQCEWEFIEELKENIDWADIVVSTACGIGVQAVQKKYLPKRVLPGLNTSFMGMPTSPGVWKERCLGCGDCVLDETGGICPIARCAKNLLNGPCGGSQNGKCEISKDIDCAWQEIYDRLKVLGLLDSMNEIALPKNWSTSRDGGPRRIVREDVNT